jgi:FlaA1/EpsC-like NDP-sugar epimerase
VNIQLSTLPRAAKDFLMVGADMLVLPVALWSAIALRTGQWSLDPGPPWWAYAATVLVSVPLFLRQGLYRAVVRYLETRAFLTVVGAALAAAVFFTLLMWALGSPGIPMTAYAIYALLSASYAVLARVIARQLLRQKKGAPRRESVAVYGAGAAGRQLVQALRQAPDFRPVLWVDDNPKLHGRSMIGLPIVSSTDLPAAAERLAVRVLIVAIPSLTPGQRAELLQRLEPLQLDVRLIPSVSDMLGRSDLGLTDMRRVSPEDLLGRDAVQLDNAGLRLLLAQRVVLVTGAGGSIGSELCRQIVEFNPLRLVCLDSSEFALYALKEEFDARWPHLDAVYAIGDVKYGARVESILRTHSPSLIFHAAAYKHVPLMEEVNAWEAVRNNTWGTYIVARAAIKYGVDKFVLVSTDKAVNPTNVMGATKLLAEQTCQALQREGKTRFEIVRFGNVLGSSGSVIPKFRDQIARGGPVTVTHPDIVRFFMSIPEAAQLVLQAAMMGDGGEVFVLDMGDPIRIVELARRMIRLSGSTENQIKIEFTGLRPGEKLYEELLADSEFTRPTHHPKIRIARSLEVPDDWGRRLTDWVQSCSTLSDAEVRSQLAKFLPQYQPWRAVVESGGGIDHMLEPAKASSAVQEIAIPSTVSQARP